MINEVGRYQIQKEGVRWVDFRYRSDYIEWNNKDRFDFISDAKTKCLILSNKECTGHFRIKDTLTNDILFSVKSEAKIN